jgi:hypothetical protein
MMSDQIGTGTPSNLIPPLPLGYYLTLGLGVQHETWKSGQPVYQRELLVALVCWVWSTPKCKQCLWSFQIVANGTYIISNTALNGQRYRTYLCSTLLPKSINTPTVLLRSLSIMYTGVSEIIFFHLSKDTFSSTSN